MLMLTFIAGCRRFALSLEAAGEDTKHAENMVVWCAIGGVVGARLVFVLSNFSEFLKTPLEFIFTGAGFVFYGGFIGGVLAGWIYTRRENLAFWRYADLCAPCLAIGYAVGRIGCHLAGDGDYGIPTELPWGFRYQLGVVPTAEGVYVHPAPIYESLVAFAICFLLVRLQEKNYFKHSGQLFGLYLLCSALSRFLVEFIRVNPDVYQGFSQAQVISVVLICLAGVLLLKPSLLKIPGKL